MANVPVITEPDWDGKTPYSRSEAILLSIINGTPIDTEKWEGIPLSRGEYLLLQLKDVIEDNSMLDFKGRVDSVDDLPSTGNKKGDVYSVGSESQLNRPEYFWTGTSWEYFGQIVDLSGYATLQEVQTAINAAVNSLTTMVDYTYLKRTGGEIYYTDAISDSGRIYFNNPDGDRTGSIGRGTIGSNTDFCLETYGKSLELVNTGGHLYVDSKTGPLNVVSRRFPLTINSETAPLYIQYAGNSVMTVQSPTRVILNTYQDAAKIDMNNTDISGTADNIIEFVTDSGPFTKMINTVGARHWTAGLGATTFIDLDGSTGRVIANQPLRAKSSVLTSVISMIDPTSQTEASIGQITASSSGIGINGSSVSIGGASISLYGSSISIGGGSILLNNNPLRATVLLTQAEYDALETKDPNVVYNIYEPDEEEGE